MFCADFQVPAKGRACQRSTLPEKKKHLHRWITIPHFLVILCDIVIVIPAIMVWYNIKQAMPPADQTVRVYRPAMGLELSAARPRWRPGHGR